MCEWDRNASVEEMCTVKLSLSCQCTGASFFLLFATSVNHYWQRRTRTFPLSHCYLKVLVFFLQQQPTGKWFWHTFNNVQSDGQILTLSIRVSCSVRPSREEAAGPVCWQDVERWSSMHYSVSWLLVSAYQVTAARRTGKYIQ